MKNHVLLLKKEKKKKDMRSFLIDLKNGDHNAFRKLYDQYGEELFRYLKAQFYFNDEIAKDILQDVFITAYTKIGSLKDIEKIRSWLYRIAFNKGVDIKRAKKKEKGFIMEIGEQLNTLEPPSMEDKLMKKEMLNILNIEAEKLPDFLRQVYLLRIEQNLPYQDIADITKTSVPRVKKAMKKIILTLYQEFKQRNINEDVLLR